MNVAPLFTTARVLRAAQQIAMSAVFFYYLTQRLKDGRKIHRSRRRAYSYHD